MTVKEVATKLNISQNTVKQIERRALKKVKATFAAIGIKDSWNEIASKIGTSCR